MSDKKLFEIKPVAQEPEDVVDVGEFTGMHKQLFRIPLMSGGCILVKRLGFLEGSHIQSKYKEWYTENEPTIARMVRLSKELKQITATEDPTEEQAGRMREIFKEFLESPLLDPEAQEMFLDYVQAIIVKPEELRDRDKLEEFMAAMDPAERVVFSGLIGDFLAQKKT